MKRRKERKKLMWRYVDRCSETDPGNRQAGCMVIDVDTSPAASTALSTFQAECCSLLGTSKSSL
jgi:hypothetical protein